MLNSSFARGLATYLVFAMLLLTIPAQGWAMFLPNVQAESTRNADRAAIQKYLESAVVKQRLLDYGLTQEEASARINSLSDEQVHQLSTRLDAVQAGADDGLGLLVFLLLVAIIVVVALQVSGRSVVIR